MKQAIPKHAIGETVWFETYEKVDKCISGEVLEHIFDSLVGVFYKIRPDKDCGFEMVTRHETEVFKSFEQWEQSIKK